MNQLSIVWGKRAAVLTTIEQVSVTTKKRYEKSPLAANRPWLELHAHRLRNVQAAIRISCHAVLHSADHIARGVVHLLSVISTLTATIHLADTKACAHRGHPSKFFVAIEHVARLLRRLFATKHKKESLYRLIHRET